MRGRTARSCSAACSRTDRGRRDRRRAPCRQRARRVSRIALAALLALAAGSGTAQLLEFDGAELRAILRHGPWPAAWSPDPSNRVSGNPRAIELGERLFFEPRLSAAGKVLCATCHAPFRGWQDSLPRARGLAEVERNTLSVLNVRYNRWFGWDGAGDTLWAQSIRPILEPREMGGSAAQAAAQRGLRIFVGRGNCSACHFGPNFSNGEFHDTGVPFFIAGGGVDPGRHGGIRKLQSSRFNLLGPHSDDAGGKSATKTRHIALEHRNFGEFKVPGLRNVALTAPYMHNGSLATLADVVRHYSELSADRLHADGESLLLRPLRLSAQESGDLVEFLESLTERASVLPPKRPAGPCR